MTNNYLESVKQQFTYYKGLGEKVFEQVTDEQLFWKYNEESNSIATLVLHLHGNMLSRWTNFLTSDGEKEWRNRDTEFETEINDRQTIISKWNEGWDCLFKALNSINQENINSIIYIRAQKHTLTEAINRQLAHYPYHIGQMIFIGKMIQNNFWTSLSIPRKK